MQVVQFIDAYNDKKSNTNFIILVTLLSFYGLYYHTLISQTTYSTSSIDVVPCKVCWFCYVLPFKDGMGCFGYCSCMRNLLTVAAGAGVWRIV